LHLEQFKVHGTIEKLFALAQPHFQAASFLFVPRFRGQTTKHGVLIGELEMFSEVEQPCILSFNTMYGFMPP
jgi:hypothetical protein